jgi:hypothetical protein
MLLELVEELLEVLFEPDTMLSEGVHEGLECVVSILLRGLHRLIHQRVSEGMLDTHQLAIQQLDHEHAALLQASEAHLVFRSLATERSPVSPDGLRSNRDLQSR